VHLGSTWLIKARDAWMPWTKLRNVEQGLALIDKSLSLLAPEHDRTLVNGLPVSAWVRATAGITLIGLPDMFKRFDQGRNLLRDLTGRAAAARGGRAAKTHIYYYAGQAARRDDDLAEAAHRLPPGARAHAGGRVRAPRATGARRDSLRRRDDILYRHARRRETLSPG